MFGTAIFFLSSQAVNYDLKKKNHIVIFCSSKCGVVICLNSGFLFLPLASGSCRLFMQQRKETKVKIRLPPSSACCLPHQSWKEVVFNPVCPSDI